MSKVFASLPPRRRIILRIAGVLLCVLVVGCYLVLNSSGSVILGIHSAAANGDILRLQRIVRIFPGAVNSNPGAILGFTYNIHHTPLHAAVENNQLQATVLLVEHGANLHIGDIWDRTPLYYALLYDRIDILAVLLNATTDPLPMYSRPDEDPLSPFRSARSKTAVALLAEHNYISYSQRAILDYAIAFHDNPLLLDFLEKGVSPDALSWNEVPALLFAASICNWGAVEILMQQGANVTALTFVDSKGRSICYYALTCHDGNIFWPQLKSAGADINSVNANGDTVLHVLASESVSEKNSRAAYLALLAGCNIGIKNKQGKTAYDVASYRRDTQFLLNLFDQSASPDTLSMKDDLPALLIAASKSNWDAVEILVQQGLSNPTLNTMDSMGRSIYYYALTCHRGNIFLPQLKFAGADINSVNANGDTVLHVLAKESVSGKNNRAIFLALLAGCNVDIKNKQGKTAYDVATDEIIRKILAPQTKSGW